MPSPLSVTDALALLSKSSLPTLLTEGTDDYRVMRKVENRLADLGVDFLPLGGRLMVLDVWRSLPAHRHNNTAALVDLDCWLYCGIPSDCIGDNLIYTKGYSIENDIMLDCDLTNLMDAHEESVFYQELEIVSAYHAREIEKAKSGLDFSLATHVNAIIGAGDISPSLCEKEKETKQIIIRFFKQNLRGKSLLELLVRQLNRPGRFAKIGYRPLYEFGSMNIGSIFQDLESSIRSKFI